VSRGRHRRGGSAGHRRGGGRRWPLASLAGAAALLAAGLASGSAFAYFGSSGTGGGGSFVGAPVAVTLTAVGGGADLLPAGNGALHFTVRNANPFGATFTRVVTAGTPVSTDPAACPSSDLTVVQTLPFTFSPAVSVGADATSGPQAIPDFVQLSPDAPDTCQGVTFTLDITLNGTAS
jgi:hypothetical protein